MSKLDFDLPALSRNPRATHSAWLRYEHIVASAIARSPAPFVYQPVSLSPLSVASKLRDAIKGRLAFDYPSSIDTAVLRTWWAGVVVTHDHEKVYIGPKEKMKGKIDGSVHGDFAFMFDTLTSEELEAFELLLNSGRIKGPVMVNNPPKELLNDPLGGVLSNVERIFRPDGKLILL